MAIPVKFYGIDSWNRPVYIDQNKNFYGSTDILADSKQEADLKIKPSDITYFGRKFDCEPWGDACDVVIVEEFDEVQS